MILYFKIANTTSNFPELANRLKRYHVFGYL